MRYCKLARQGCFEDMNRLIKQHRITPVVDREFTFDGALEALTHMAEQRHFGKLAINVAEG
jgi:NADPH:quinone reductase-like Zn-dependent oxidoreductase